ncbi:MAG: HAMP domain-containing histidine kinase, partial [Lachnospiraceae bacterium]|nr:HAMP domain-containing histidine kinase [Lachnospiraceae bacterium]
GNTPVEFERFDLTELIRSVLSTTDILAKQKDVTVHFEQNEPVYVWADEYMIEEVLTNYISNAFHHVSGANIIEVKLIPVTDGIRVAVFNTGAAIPEEELDKVWIKFYKVDKARTREYGGNGIGLSIVKAIMEAHNRSYGVKNHATGVEFWFELDNQAEKKN